MGCGESLEIALKNTGINQDRIEHIGGTGSGAKSIQQADITVNDLKAIAAVANFFFPNCKPLQISALRKYEQPN